jgi:Lrp/AsnC family transcriptional regulator, leucine-responsive regulatory protein
MEDMAAIVGRRTRPARAPAATERVRKLEAAGVITGYRSTVNAPSTCASSRCVQQTPEVINAYNVTGEDS